MDDTISCTTSSRSKSSFSNEGGVDGDDTIDDDAIDDDEKKAIEPTPTPTVLVLVLVELNPLFPAAA